VQLDASGVNYVPWTDTDTLWINPVTLDINVVIDTV